MLSRVPRFRGVKAAVYCLTGLAGVSVLPGIMAPAAAQPGFRTRVSAGVSDGIFPGGLVIGGQGRDTPVAANLSMVGFTATFGSEIFTASATAQSRGIWSTGTYASGQVLNAFYPTSTPVENQFDPPFGFFVLGGMGSFTRHRFVTPESLTGVFGQFHWHVDGTSSTNLGIASSRLDFAVTQGAMSFSDLYNSTITPNIMTQIGPGTYTYTTGIALDTPLDFLFWSSAFWNVNQPDLVTLGSSPRTIFGQAEFLNTFNLDSIDLFKSDGSRLTTWNLLDEATGQVIFNQNGRVGTAATEAPEPSSAGLLFGAGIAATGLVWHRRRCF